MKKNNSPKLDKEKQTCIIYAQTGGFFMEKNTKSRLIALALSLTTLTSASSCEKVGKSENTIKTSEIVTTQPTLEPVTQERAQSLQNQIDYMNVQDLCAHLNSYIYVNKVKSLTDEIREYMNIELTEEQKQRYDTLLEKTLSKAEECKNYYELNDIISFNASYNELCRSKEYINIDDLIEIYVFAVNKFYGENVVNSENYMITDNSLIINGIKINNLTKKQEAVDVQNPFTIINYYDSNEKYDEETMNLMNSLQVKLALPTLIKNIRIVMDTNANEFYTYSEASLKETILNKKQEISTNCDVTSWEYDPNEQLYIVYNKYGIGNKCKNNSYITNMLDDIFELEQFQKNTDYCDNIEEIKDIINKEKQKTR